MKITRIGLVGDFNPEIIAHDATNRSVELFCKSAARSMEARWINTEEIVPNSEGMLQELDGIWCVPGSPYKNTAGALWAIQLARTRLIPFLGTCGGFQHALLEFARDALGMPLADHEELNPRAGLLLLNRLQCSLVEKKENVLPTGQGKFRTYYESCSGLEDYHCDYGLNPACENLFHKSPFKVVARSANGEVRAIELEGHPFFIATLFQPERRSFAGVIHPVVREFLVAAQCHSKNT